MHNNSNKAIFLDRDGVVNKERGYYTWKIEDFEFTSGLFEFLKKIKNKGYFIFIITNQGGIAKKVYDFTDVEKLNNYIFEKFQENNTPLTDLYYCPHHSDLEKCLCRKPDSLMLEKAIARYKINPSESYFIGDNQRDVDAGNKAGVQSIKIEPNQNLNEILHLIK
jgi:D-glycero-D-manno-heptose 1,7-bisphosphate phosphatase